MKILVDTSVWSLALARREPSPHPAVERLARAITDGDVVLLGVVLQETLQAFKADRDFARAAKALSNFPLLQLSRADYVASARLHRRCRAAGVAASTTDCMIATAAVQTGCALLTTDADFTAIGRHCALKLLRG